MGPYFNPATRKRYRGALLRWYDQNKRDLPWRANRDPYRVWVSEVMLQQTRVAAVIDYYARFLTRFPDVQALARARESSVLAAWSGLGYYRRARGLHAAAKIIVKQYAGRFPKNANDLQSLPGIGRYTAAAVASIAFGEAVAVVDGNVERVLARMSGLDVAKKHTAHDDWNAAQELLAPERPGDFNQAMMELGATVCTPAQPLCDSCPIIKLCKTKGTAKSKNNGARKKRELQYAISIDKGRVYLVQRPADSSLMPGLWELPPLDKNIDHVYLFNARHSITDSDYTVKVAEQRAPHGSSGEWIPYHRLSRIALTGLARKILVKAGIIE